MKLPRLAPRLRFALFWPVLAAVAVTVPVIWFVVTGPLEEGAATLLLDAVEVVRPEAVLAIDLGGVETQNAVRDLAAAGAIRITLIAQSGEVVAESSLPWEAMRRMENHGGREEVRAAFATGEGTAVRRSATTGTSYAYAARSFTGGDGRTYVLRLARPLEQVRFLRRNLASVLALALVTALLFLGPVSWWLNRRLFRPLRQIIAGADRLAAGELASRVEVPDARELASLAQGLNHLAAEVEKQLRLLGEERDHLREILASMSEGVLVTDGDGRVRLANATLRRIFDLEGDLAGSAAAEVIGQPAIAELIAAALAAKTLTSGELQLEEKPRRHLSLLAAPLPRGRGVVVVVRDMTEVMRLAEIRRDLVANVSHELKTPLTAIRGYAETLEQGALDDPAVAPRFVRRIREQCERLEALLRDLLTLSRLEQLEHGRDAESVDVCELARRAVEVLTPSARERRVELKLEAGEAPRVTGLRSEVENLLLNLIDNAVKYNRPDGEARVAVRGQGGGVEIEVADTGIGIPEDALDRVFERFYRVDKGRSREQGGTGLGLAIVKHAAHLLGGRVEVESRLGEGSVFRVWLPAETDG